MNLWRRLRRDCKGGVSISEILLLNTILLLGTIAGLTVIRDTVVQQFGDLADALQSLDQSFTVNCSNVTAGYVDSGFPAPVEGSPPAGLCLGVGLEEESAS